MHLYPQTEKTGLSAQIHKRKNPRELLRQEEESSGIFYAAFIGTGEIHAPQSAHRITGGRGCVGRVIFLVGKRMQ